MTGGPYGWGFGEDRRARAVLEMEGVSKSFASPGEVVRAVAGASLAVGWGELVAIRGPSGSGKSTLLTLAAGLMRPESGRILFQGRDLASLTRRQALEHRRTMLGFVSQSSDLAGGLTARENVAIPLLMRGVSHRDAHTRAGAALAEVGLDGRLENTPERLSGGERQRVAIARALVGGPRLVLADEPTGNLDSEASAGVAQLLFELSRRHGAAVVLVTHDERVADWADRIVTMRDGVLSEGGDPLAAHGEPKPREHERAPDGEGAGSEARR